ncbi:MAG: sporulation protein YqfD, partial [Oscillospiraceae bacterium]|nr:sporulation protein YqfD [Oscillospiraceae bacterium]
ETMLRIQIPEISWAGMRHHGSKLVVEVTEETPQVEMLRERLPCHIIARYDAQITNVEVYSGQLQCLIGDGVAKGDIIVNGLIIDPETNQQYYRHAYAKITGIYHQETDFTEPFLTSRTELTGNSVRQKWFRLFNLQIPLQFIHPDYAESQSTERDVSFQLLGKELPCGMLQKITSETQTSITERSEEEVRLALNSDLVRYEKNFLADTEILDRKLEFQTTPEGMQCHAVYTVKGEIGITSEFFIDKKQSVPETEPDTDFAS